MEWQRNIKTLTTDELKAWLRDVDEKPYRADQIQKWLFCQQVRSYDEMVNISPALKEDQRSVSVDGTVKWLFQTEDGHHIETVMIPANGRYSVCVSTQVGCAMNCAFCRTAKMGFTRNLEAGEILEEIINVNWYLKDNGFMNEEGGVAQVTKRLHERRRRSRPGDEYHFHGHGRTAQQPRERPPRLLHATQPETFQHGRKAHDREHFGSRPEDQGTRGPQHALLPRREPQQHEQRIPFVRDAGEQDLAYRETIGSG